MSEKSKRLMMIYSRLKSGPVTIEMLSSWARKNNVHISTRTFYRDLYDLENSIMVPNEKLVVAVGEKNRKTWKIVYINKEEPLTEFDINSFILFQSFLPFSIISARKNSHEKFVSLFYEKYSKSQFENFVDVAKMQIKATHFFEESAFTDYDKILDDFIWSIQNKREIILLSVNYDYTSYSPQSKFPKVFLPVQILYHRGTVHISGFFKEDRRLVILGVDQIDQYKLTNNSFDNSTYLSQLETELSKRFGIIQNINDEIYDIEIEFTQRTGNFVHKQFWHTTQQFIQLENGNFIMQITCGINSEMIGWVFHWMSNAKVIKPNILVQMVFEKYKKMAKTYENGTVLVTNSSYSPTEVVDNL